MSKTSKKQNNAKKPVAGKTATGTKKPVRAGKSATGANKGSGRATQPAKRTPNGRTLKTKDEYLPQEKGKVKELKDKRWVAVIDSNKKNELAVVRLTDEEQKNTTALPTYKKGNNRDTYFKHFVETEDNEGNPIKATKNGKFQENPAKYDLSAEEVSKIRSKVYRHSKQATSNQDKINKLKEDDK